MLKTTIGFAKIDYTGLKQVALHTLIVGLAAVAAYLISLAKVFNFGSYEALAMVALTLVISFLTKFFGTYDVPLVVVAPGVAVPVGTTVASVPAGTPVTCPNGVCAVK